MKHRIGKLLLRTACVGLLVGVGVGLHEVYNPASIAWRPITLAGQQADRAPGLVLQDRRGHDLFATIGFTIYRSQAGGPFERVHTIVPRPSEAWAGFSRSFRRWFRYQELVELVALDGDRLVAFAGGDVYRIDLPTGTEARTHRLRYYGRGEGRGLMPHGVTRAEDGTLYYGEYPTRHLHEQETVRVWRSPDDGRSWHVAHEFEPHFIRHIHAVQWDPHGKALWVATGDRDHESRIGYSTDGGATFQWVGGGSQEFRACSLMFTPERVTWAMDAPAVDSRILSYVRSTGQIETSGTILPSPGYYTRSLGERGGLVTLAERSAAVWLVGEGPPTELLSWPVVADPSRPHPSVRLVRSAGSAEGWFTLNPLRTEAEDAAIYRLSTAARRPLQAAARSAETQLR